MDDGMDGATQEWDPSIGLSLEMGSSSIGSDGGTGVCCGCNAMDAMAGVCAVSETFPDTSASAGHGKSKIAPETAGFAQET